MWSSQSDGYRLIGIYNDLQVVKIKLGEEEVKMGIVLEKYL